MKVTSLPKDLPAPKVDYHNFDLAKAQADQDAHLVALKAKLISLGYTGKYTGEIYAEYVADGQALYMFADLGRKSVLVHLPYGDGYRALHIQYVPISDIKKMIDAQKAFSARFAKSK